MGVTRDVERIEVGRIGVGMPRSKQAAGSQDHSSRRPGVDVVPREYAGRWIAWSADSRRIVATGASFAACEAAAARAGFPSDQVAIERVPTGRQRLTGSGR